MPISRGGVYHNLKESKYVVSENDVTYFFSSRLYRKMFLNGRLDNRITFKQKISRCSPELYSDDLADISWYKHVEKRGFRIKLRGREANWHETLKYALEQKIKHLSGD